MDPVPVRKPILQGEYKLLKELECFEDSTLFLACSLHNSERRYAVKEVPVEGGQSSDAHREVMDYFRQVATPYVEVQHAGLTTLKDYFFENEAEYVVFDYVPGHRLAEVMALRARPFLECQAVDVILKMATILDWMHSHRPPLYFADLNPNNVLMTPRGEVILTDFGLGRLLAPRKPGEPRLGTLGYAPPEQFGHAAVISRTNDVYALGVLMHQMVTGVDPTIRPGVFAPVRELNPFVSEDYAEVVAMATQADPTQRFAEAMEISARLKGLAPRRASLRAEPKGNLLDRLRKVLTRPFTDSGLAD